MPSRLDLEQELDGLLQYAAMKLKAKDYHAVADAMMDAREIDAQIRLLQILEAAITPA